MLTVIRHLPIQPLRDLDHDNLTPAEVTAWLDARDRAARLRRWDRAINLALALVAALLICTTIAFFTR